VAPLEGLHKESLEDVEAQLQVLLPMLKGSTLPPTLPLLNGSFNSWLEGTIGIHVRTNLLSDVQYSSESVFCKTLKPKL